MTDEGFVKIYRSMLDWEWFTDPNTAHLWLYLLIEANWKDKRYKGMSVPRGTLVTTYTEISDRTGLTINEIRTALKHLESTGEISKKLTGKSQFITVENYNAFQVCELELNRESTGKSQGSHREVTGLYQYITLEEERKNIRIKESKNKECNQDILPNIDNISNINTLSTLAQNDAFFATFWEKYPRKKGKGAAEKAFRKLNVSQELFDAMLVALEQEKQSSQWKRDNGNYIPYPATWLNQKRWEDDNSGSVKRSFLDIAEEMERAGI